MQSNGHLTKINIVSLINLLSYLYEKSSNLNSDSSCEKILMSHFQVLQKEIKHLLLKEMIQLFIHECQPKQIYILYNSFLILTFPNLNFF